MQFPEKILVNDMDLFLKECKLAGCEIVQSASKRFVWVYEGDQFFGLFEEDDGWLKLIDSGDL